MGCASSKKVDATTPYDLYRPPPSSFATFDINAIEEPWLKLDDFSKFENQHKPSHVPPPLLEKLDTLEKDVSEEPRTWEEVSKALDIIKKPAAVPSDVPDPNKKSDAGSVWAPRQPRKSFSFHTLSELEGPKDEEGNKLTRLKRAESSQNLSGMSKGAGSDKQMGGLRTPESVRSESNLGQGVGSSSGSLKANPFIQRDRMEREKEGKEAAFDRIMKSKQDPLSSFPEKCPPGGANSVVLYTTSLGGIRKTFENCNRVRAILENHRVVFDERDVSLHGEFLAELRSVVGEDLGVPVPRLFVKGRYLGGVDEVVELNEAGRLGRILSTARVERGVGWLGCEGCGGARFVPCMECGGSCKVIVDDDKQRCPKCNENGLVHCPLCH
ncbi:hypothetical protein RND81_06G250400 [Saponaria officinalis]|uniref:Glutaredoxin domain-containing protein n=1 Tax=Saponaria officinalis TaxID=3572 RepID=A0AAW1KE90_SAPOF